MSIFSACTGLPLATQSPPKQYADIKEKYLANYTQ